MSYSKTKEYEIIPLETYKIIRNCAGCRNKSTYYSTGHFRVNANGSQLDVWLIYQCIKCRHTFNLAICERVKITDIKAGKYEQFLSNDAELAFHYGLDKQIFRKNKAEVCWNDISYQIGVMTPENKIQEGSFTIRNPYELRIDTDKAIAKILPISRSRIKSMIQEGSIRFEQKKLEVSTDVQII